MTKPGRLTRPEESDGAPVHRDRQRTRPRRFTLKLHRGDGMTLLAMNWKATARPPDDFVGFAIEYKEPGGDRFFAFKNRLGFRGADGKVDPNTLSTRLVADPEVPLGPLPTQRRARRRHSSTGSRRSS